MHHAALCHFSSFIFKRSCHSLRLSSSNVVTKLSYSLSNFGNVNDDTTTFARSNRYMTTGKNDKNDTTKQHSMFEKQMRELANERTQIFGINDDDNSNPLQQPLPDQEEETILSPFMDAELLEQLQKEREALFHFEKEEIQAWSSTTEGENHSKDLMEQIRLARSERDAAYERQKAAFASSFADYTKKEDAKETSAHVKSSSSFTHLSPSSLEDTYMYNATMVDVGDKETSKRVAIAQSKVVFPPEVMKEFQISGKNEDMVGPKGPIFETARLAGIMGAKKTQDLIPLCHPLPLNYINITIQLVKNEAIIICECRVTHKTGVEMEALTGASIAALTIYDMVKAVSHRVRIEGTALVSKTGGKEDVSL
uniref:cyclic pyranopterin monophosphate synthase n=1 Tax=Ditylum brightwellii TaxID=49249 RepID=A0A7S4V1F9_9STRA|mmetsp:Transcript_15540/g.22306  ORF Transcript_15540/g.22306 Transcript_15540/m.22306 type:complete len:367 (+) Transcript_15540:52-1152(+)